MNLNDFSPDMTVARLESIYKNQFSKELKVSNLTLKESKKLLQNTHKMIAEFKRTGAKARYAEKNPTYLRLKMVEEAVSIRIANLAKELSTKLNEGSRTMTPKYVKALRAVASGKKLKESQIKSLKVSRGLRQILESRKTSIAFMRKLVEAKRAGKQALTEGEIDTAQTTLAAQDIADQIQTMIEKFADIRYKELPALNDSIRNSKGVEEANSFTETVLGSLESLTGSLETAKMEINNAVSGLTGGEMTPMGGDLDMDDMEGDIDIDADLEMGGDDMGMGGDDMGMGGDDMDLGDEFDMDFEDEDELDLGRARR